MKSVIMGGSFDPPHLGHVALAEDAYSKLECDKFFIVPTKTSPFKINGSISDPQHRLNMLNLSFDDKFIIEDCEIRRSGISYTIDTLKYLITKYDLDKPYLLIGDDLIEGFRKWKNYVEILQISTIVIANRVNKNSFQFEHILLNNNTINLSSSFVRDKIIQGEDFKDFVSLGVHEYILNNNLYRSC